MGLMTGEQGKHLPSPSHFWSVMIFLIFFSAHLCFGLSLFIYHQAQAENRLCYLLFETPNPILEWLLVQKLE